MTRRQKPLCPAELIDCDDFWPPLRIETDTHLEDCERKSNPDTLEPRLPLSPLLKSVNVGRFRRCRKSAIMSSSEGPRKNRQSDGLRESMHQVKERVIVYKSPTRKKHMIDDGGQNTVESSDSNGRVKVAPSRLKPLIDDIINHAQSSISHLTFNVHDAAGGKSFDSCYEKQDILGEGGFALVYRCFHLERKHTYAVKEILKDDYEGSGENLREEIDALRRLQDIPYVVRLMDVFHEDDVCYLVMEEMKGGDMLERLCDVEVFDEVDGRKISRRLLDAIFYCHKKHVCHRDIKPENILMSSKESNTMIKLADFGCAKRFDPGMSLYTLCGSPQYVAPELYTHDGYGYDERCDLWSIGAVIFVILGGYAPFDGDDNELPENICKGHFEFHEQYWSGISEPPRDVIRSLLQVDLCKRATLREVLDSEWLRRRDRDKMENSKNLDQSLTSFEAWCQSQHSQENASGNGSLVATENSLPTSLYLPPEDADHSSEQSFEFDGFTL